MHQTPKIGVAHLMGLMSLFLACASGDKNKQTPGEMTSPASSSAAENERGPAESGNDEKPPYVDPSPFDPGSNLEVTKEGATPATEKPLPATKVPAPSPPRVRRRSPGGHVQLVASIGEGFGRTLMDVEVVGDTAFVSSSAGTIFQIPTSGGAPEILHDSKGGSTDHGGNLRVIRGELHYLVDRREGTDELYRWNGEAPVKLAEIDDLLFMAGDEERIYATRFKKDDIVLPTERGVAVFLKTPRPDEVKVVGHVLYWLSYKRGTVSKIDLKSGKQERIARARRAIGLAIVGDTVFYGSEVGGAIFALPERGKPKRIVGGFENHDEFVSDASAIYFAAGGELGAVLRIDAKTFAVETMATGLPNASLAVHEGWVYIADGSELFRVRTDQRMPWPVHAE